MAMTTLNTIPRPQEPTMTLVLTLTGSLLKLKMLRQLAGEQGISITEDDVPCRISVPLTERPRLVLGLLCERGPLTGKTIKDALQQMGVISSHASVKARLSELVKLELVERRGLTETGERMFAVTRSGQAMNKG